MPGGDRTGPMGQGSMTGWGAGFCAGHGNAGFANSGRGRGFGCGFARGSARGWRHRFLAADLPGRVRAAGTSNPPAPLSREEEIEFLRARSEQMRQDLEQISRRLNQLESNR